MYRVQPIGQETPRSGQKVEFFKHLHDAYSIIDGWYGESCHLYELEGTVLETHEIDMQVFYHEEPVERSIIRYVDAGTMIVDKVKHIGTFEVTRVEDEVRHRYTQK